jgi:hypothetical protein
MYTVPNDPNVMKTVDGDRCRTCWLIGNAARNERRRRHNAVRAAAKARLKATKSVLGRPPAAQVLNETADEEAERLFNTIGDIESNPKDRRRDTVPALKRRLKELDDLAERDAKKAPALTEEQTDRLEWLKAGGAETDEQVEEMNSLMRLQPEQPTGTQPVKVQFPPPKSPEPMRIPLPKNIARTDK